ncbi:precorrin-2 C(20)-methyltransferase [Allobranchiibius sp. GilTou73]|uniref:precorrin-2 C(20)-methyltransferase n=1 Tax=Allobranchiibius sp. GilTou73 TaxID=2904523 RepID=UPI001F187717|nr:precorrin-2 C(20)-methyltransferase [Allobranchiibius sp. GilTou73]UIJ35195.1 precorrin-2 C(20)-methyltransferase [Allobranchiibius sp. GilTou73]
MISNTIGHLYGVGLGPGDPDLITLKAARLIASADVIAYHAGTGKSSIARAIAADLLPAGVHEEELRYPVTTGAVEHPAGYHGWLAEFYDECAARLRAHLDAGRTVVVLAEGDPMFYGSFMYLHDRLADSFPTEVVPGVTAVSGATAVSAHALARHEDVLTVLSGTLPVAELARRLADTDAAVVMKLGRTFANVREALRQAGLLDRAVYVERATRDGQRVLPAADVDPSTVPYMSIVIVPGQDRRADAAGRASAEPVPPVVASTTGTVHVVGLGPGPDRWLTPEASAILAEVDHVVGYAPYVERVPQRVGLTRHASGNTVEVDRARDALELAAAGDDVAVVSGGDAGVFGMAAAVFEAAEAGGTAYAEVPVHVVPGLTAAQAAAALVGAPLGADFAVMSLSDRLKPWSVLEARLRAAAAADLVIALYNPRSRSRPDQLHTARAALLDVKSADTVVVIARDVGRAKESAVVTTLGEFDPETVDMKCLVIIGASSTRVTPGGQVWTPRSVAQP